MVIKMSPFYKEKDMKTGSGLNNDLIICLAKFPTLLEFGAWLKAEMCSHVHCLLMKINKTHRRM